MKTHDEIEETLKEDKTSGDGIADSLSDLLDTLGDEEKHKMFSEVSEREIKHLSVLATTGDDLTKQFIREYMTMKVSKRRKGRQELGEVADSFAGVFQTESNGFIDKMKSMIP